MRDSYLLHNTSLVEQEYEAPSIEENFTHNRDVTLESMS